MRQNTDDIKLPTISIILPTYQAEKYLENCFKSISMQDYPKDKLEVLIIDGGSTDDTLKIAKKFNVFPTRILHNSYKDAESGKSIGIEAAKSDIIALIDADNELVGKNWLRVMVRPLIEDQRIFGVESPWLVRKKDPLINQYVTLLKIADPLARCFSPQMTTEDRGAYLVNHLKIGQTPVVGANGFLWRKKLIKIINKYKPKFEEVNYISLMVQRGYLVYAHVKHVGIYHYYCTSIFSYIKKRLKIGRKFMERKEKKQTTWVDQNSLFFFILAVVYNISFIGPLFEATKGYRKTANIAWFLHPFISFLTIAIYTYAYVESKARYIVKKG